MQTYHQRHKTLLCHHYQHWVDIKPFYTQIPGPNYRVRGAPLNQLRIRRKLYGKHCDLRKLFVGVSKKFRFPINLGHPNVYTRHDIQ